MGMCMDKEIQDISKITKYYRYYILSPDCIIPRVIHHYIIYSKPHVGINDIVIYGVAETTYKFTKQELRYYRFQLEDMSIKSMVDQ